MKTQYINFITTTNKLIQENKLTSRRHVEYLVSLSKITRKSKDELSFLNYKNSLNLFLLKRMLYKLSHSPVTTKYVADFGVVPGAISAEAAGT